MAEANQKQHLRRAFAVAAKLSAARAQLAAAEADVDAAENELRTLTGNTQTDLNTYYRYFECEGDPQIRLTHGNGEARCPNFVSLWPQSTEINEPKLCASCKEAHEAAAQDAKPVPVGASTEPASAAEPAEIPF